MTSSESLRPSTARWRAQECAVVDRLRVAVIGVGAMGANHALVLGALPDAELVAVADSDSARLDELSPGRPLRAYEDYRRMLDEERPDAVTIAVPTRLHEEVALACIERGVPLLVEKPLAASVEEGERLRAAAESAGVPLMVGHVERFNPAVRELAQRLRDGAIGRVYQVRTRRVGPFYPRERDVGVAYDLATHDIDVLRMLLGCEVEQVHAEAVRGVRTEYEDAIVGLLRFEDGTIAVLEANWLSPVKLRELSVFGEQGMCAVDYLTQTLQQYVTLSDEQAKPDEVSFPDPGQAPLRAELSAFLRVVRGLEQLPVTAEDGIAAMRVADALVASAARGGAVELATARRAR
jgi:UDP-N-acetylglucosamine 3-dehydrogenase